MSLSDLFAVPDDDRASSEATRLVRLALDSGVRLLHDEMQVPYVCLDREGHVETLALSGKGFRGWLRQRAYEQRKKAVSAQAVTDALGTLEGMALFDGPEAVVSTRLGGDRHRVVIDLGDDAWRAVEVTAAGWRILDKPDLHFRRSGTSQSLPDPEPGGSLDELRKFVNVPDGSWPLVLGWLIAAASPAGPYPMLWLQGEQGTAKSTTASFLRRMIDPVQAARRSAPKSDRDLMITASNCWVLLLDNLTKVSEEQSNALARLSTGGGYATRALYTDSEEVVFDLTRPVMVTGIHVRGVREDVQERAITLELPVIERGGRRREREMEEEFDRAWPRLFGALLDAVACAIRRQDDVASSGAVRMADAAVWMTAAEPALGLADGAIVDAWTRHERNAADVRLEADPTAMLLDALLLVNSTFEGTQSELLSELHKTASETDREELPGSAAKLSARLKEIAPMLRTRGVTMQTRKRGPGGRRLVRIELDRDARDDRDA